VIAKFFLTRDRTMDLNLYFNNIIIDIIQVYLHNFYEYDFNMHFYLGNMTFTKFGLKSYFHYSPPSLAPLPLLSA
jgi:hypothetical protein